MSDPRVTSESIGGFSVAYADERPWLIPGNPGYIPPSATELMGRLPVPLKPDYGLMEFDSDRERRKFMARAAADFDIEPPPRGRVPISGEVRLPIVRSTSRAKPPLFPDRHPRAHRVLRRFGPYVRRQSRRLDEFYERRHQSRASHMDDPVRVESW